MPQTEIDGIVSGGAFTVELRDPRPPQIYKLGLGPGDDLRNAHSYLRSFPEVRAAAPSVRLFERGVPPAEGTPPELATIGAEEGWAALERLRGTVGVPDVVLASIATEKFNIEHADLWSNVWLNQDEMMAVCDLLTCDVDSDGLITLRDLNDARFPPSLVPPDANGDGRYTCVDLIADVPENPYMADVDDPADPYPDDICGWNFATMSNDVIGASDHDSAVAGIMSARGDTDPASSPGVGVCWNCRIMPVIAAQRSPTDSGTLEGVTAELLLAFRYARDHGAAVANLAAGVHLRPDNVETCASDLGVFPVDRKAYDTVLAEMDAAVRGALGGGPTTALFTLAGGECAPGISEDAQTFYDWPPEAFDSGTETERLAVTVAALDVTDPSGTIFSNVGEVFDVAAPGAWTGLVNGTGDTASSAGRGTSFASATVAVVAGLLQTDSPNPGTLDAVELRTRLLAPPHVVPDSRAEGVTGSRLITMAGLGDDTSLAFAPHSPPACGTDFDEVDFPFIAHNLDPAQPANRSIPEMEMWDIPPDPNCVSTSSFDGPCWHYVNNVDYTRRVLANQHVAEFGFFLEAFSTEPTNDYLEFGADGAAPTTLHGEALPGIPGWRTITPSGSLQANPGRFFFHSDPDDTAAGFLIQRARVCSDGTPDAAESALEPMMRYQGVLLSTNDVVYAQTPVGSAMGCDTHSAIAMWGQPAPSNDFDVYVACDRRPTPTDYDFAGQSTNSEEFIHLPADPDVCPCDSTWHVAVHARSGRGWFNVVRSDHYAAQHHRLTAGIAFGRAPSAEEYESVVRALREGAARFFGASEGTQIIDGFDLWLNAGSTCDSFSNFGDCGGDECGICFVIQEGDSQGFAGRVLMRSSTGRYQGDVLAHELGHSLLDLFDEYETVGGATRWQCGHSMMGSGFNIPRPHNWCYSGDHRTDPHPAAGRLQPGVDAVWSTIYPALSPWQPVETPDYFSYVTVSYTPGVGSTVDVAGRVPFDFNDHVGTVDVHLNP